MTYYEKCELALEFNFIWHDLLVAGFWPVCRYLDHLSCDPLAYA